MEQKIRCQSCGIPLGEFTTSDGKTIKNFGTNADGSFTKEYCQFCYQMGSFTKPDLAVTDMITLSIDNMVQEQHIPEDRAKELATSIIPALNRWKQ